MFFQTANQVFFAVFIDCGSQSKKYSRKPRSNDKTRERGREEEDKEKNSFDLCSAFMRLDATASLALRTTNEKYTPKNWLIRRLYSIYCYQTLKAMLHTLSIKVYNSCHQLWFSLPLHITSVPFHVLFSMHRLAAEPFRTNPSLHSNDTMSPRLYLLPYFRPFMGVPRTGQSVSAKSTI